MKSKVAIINVYFGKLPQWFQLWLNSYEKIKILPGYYLLMTIQNINILEM